MTKRAAEDSQEPKIIKKLNQMNSTLINKNQMNPTLIVKNQMNPTLIVKNQINPTLINKNQINPTLINKNQINSTLINKPKIYELSNTLRKVIPYDYTYTTFAKGRWLGKSIISVFHQEFKDKSPEYYTQAIKHSKIKINNKPVTADTLIKNGDVITHDVHRHETPVSGDAVEVVFQNDTLMVVNKPAGIPVHPNGRYNHNSLVNIIVNEGLVNVDTDGKQKNLYPINRLDRLTSGLVLLAIDKNESIKLSKSMRERNIRKTYLCRVRGEFPLQEITCSEPIHNISPKLGVNIVSPLGKPCCTKFLRKSYNGRTSLIEAFPQTGRTHQIRVHLQFLGFPIANDPIYATEMLGPVNNEEDARRILEGYEKQTFPVHQDVIVSNVDSDSILQCMDCKSPRSDPIPEQLKIYLHAKKYESDDFCYETKVLPDWTDDGYTGDSILEDRFYKFNCKWDGKRNGEF